jgi:hypothetical protein
MSELNEVIVRDNAEEILKRGIADLIFSFKDLTEDSQWMSISGMSNEDKFCIAIGLNDKAVELEKMTKESFLNEDRN